MAADHPKKRSNAPPIATASSADQSKLKRKKFHFHTTSNNNNNNNISLEWDGAKKAVVPKREQTAISRRDLLPFLHASPPGHNVLADVITLPREIFGLQNLAKVLTYEVWHTCLSESERTLLTQFLPRGVDPDEVVEELLAGDNFHFGNPFLKWGSLLCSGNFHPDNIVYHEQCFKSSKKAYYLDLRKYHNDMIENLQTWKENLASCEDPEEEIVQRIWRLQGKVALITGGASGIGKATASEFIKHGARVVIADLDAQLGPSLASYLGPQAHFVPCDVADESHIEAAVNTTVSLHGKLDIMYNNAGIAGAAFPPSIADLDLDEFDRVMRINLRGMIAGIKHAARVMIPAGSGSILCTSSISGIMGGLGAHPYTISKFAIPGAVKSLASELCKHGIRINCISPCPIPTPMVIQQITQIFPSASEEKIIEIVNGFGELKGGKCEEIDVARAAVYLASEESKYVSGHNLVVDGGFTSFKHLNFASSSV